MNNPTLPAWFKPKQHVPWLIAGGLAVGLIVAASLSAVNYGAAVDAQQQVRELRDVEDELADADKEIADLKRTVSQYKPAYDARLDVLSQQADLDRREEKLAAQEDKLDERATTLDAQETSVASREAALRDGDEAWIRQIRECLNRGGSYINASVTVTSFSGQDVSCYTG